MTQPSKEPAQQKKIKILPIIVIILFLVVLVYFAAGDGLSQFVYDNY